MCCLLFVIQYEKWGTNDAGIFVRRHKECARNSEARDFIFGAVCWASFLGCSSAKKPLASKAKAKTLLEAYWKINFSIKVFTESLEVKKVDKENWIYNPISKFWYYLRNEKDKFSVINQSSAVYCFNIWVYNCTKAGIWPVTQSHDDQLYIVDEDKADETQAIINNAMEKVNEQLRLNVRLDCETQTGNNVAETH
jgi:hypothetical protein